MAGEMVKGVFSQFQLLDAKERREFIRELCVRYSSLICKEFLNLDKCWCGQVKSKRGKNT